MGHDDHVVKSSGGFIMFAVKQSAADTVALFVDIKMFFHKTYASLQKIVS